MRGPNGVDLLAFAPHPDDAELGVGATLALHARLGYRVAIIDLTLGELGTNGDPGIRQVEAGRAATILGVCHRENLGLPDGHLGVVEEHVRAVVRCLRRLRPNVILFPVGPDRHPDHEAAAELIRRAVFLSGLVRYDAGNPGSLGPHRPRKMFGYLLHAQRLPDLIVDVSSVYDSKRQALSAFASQFGSEGMPTYINQPSFLASIEARDRYYGSLIGVHYGEGLISQRPLLVTNLVTIG